jgi:hypothetical protein
MLKFLTTWIVMIGFLVWLNRSTWGKPVLYWLLWLAFLLLLVTHADELASLVNPQALQLNG